MNFGIVILHYKTMEKTVKCIQCFAEQEKSSNNNVRCVVVDNGSNDGSSSFLKQYISKYVGFDVLELKQNIVFSKAMNEGVKYLNRMFDYQMDFLILSNNDISFETRNLYQLITASFEKYGFAVMGPDIYSVATKAYSNPIAKKPNFGFFFNICSLIKSDLDLITKKWKKGFGTIEQSNTDHLMPKIDCMLHGAFLVFSKKYLSIFPNGIYPQKSFYMEENLLFFLCKINNLLMVYDPTIYINHIHSVTIEKMFDDNQTRKRKFVMEQHRKSKKTLIYLILKHKFGKKICFK